jgi:misacylated tRNA(Ala) deacylase
VGKNYDPRMHTAEHILNQTMVRMFGCGRCFSAHIEKKKSKCDYLFDHLPTDEEIKDIQERVNEVIDSDVQVTEKRISFEAAAKIYDLARLPDSKMESIRIVDVGSYDSCPCIGPHVTSTGRIGRFRIVSSDFADGVLRIRFRLDRGK